MTPAEIAADEAEHAVLLDRVRQASRRYAPPPPKIVRPFDPSKLGRMAAPFTSREEEAPEKTETRTYTRMFHEMRCGPRRRQTFENQ